MISRDVTFLDKSFEDWVNVKDPAIVPLAAEVIDTIDEDYEVDAPHLISPDTVSDDESMMMMMTHAKVMIFKFLFSPFLRMETISMMKILMMMNFKNQLFKWILKNIMQC